MKDIKSEPEDVQDFYYTVTELLDLIIDFAVSNKKTIKLNSYVHTLSAELYVDQFKFKNFLKTFSGNKYIDKFFINGDVCTKQRFYFIKENAIKKLKRNGRLKRAYADQFNDYECVYDTGNLYL